MRTTPEQRQLMAKAVKNGNYKNIVAKVFGVCVKTVSRWCKRDKKPGPKCFKDKPRKAKEGKVTLEVELTILGLRNTFNYGAARIQPKNILTDNKPFKKEWKKWCKGRGVKALFVHPYYPQDKGKVERAIRNIAEEFIYHLKNFSQWINGKIKNYKQWYNHKRYHRGINDYPANLFIGH